MAQLSIPIRDGRLWLTARAREPSTGWRSPRVYPALVDTGASFSAIPAEVVRDFEKRGCPLAARPPADVSFASGATATVAAVLAEIELTDAAGELWISSVDRGECSDGVLILPRRFVIVGVDMLLGWRLTVDWPKQLAFADVPAP